MRQSPSADWTRFGYDASRSSDNPHPTGITAANVASLTRQQVELPGTVDSSPIYLKGVTVEGSLHDTLFVTTSYGLTLAIDAHTGAILWQYTPPKYAFPAGRSRITTAAPVADPDRKWIYAASPDGRIQKLSVADGSVGWRVRITWLWTREKISSPLNFVHRQLIATTAGFGDQAPYQGHVAIISPGGRLLHVWNALCSDRTRLLVPASCPASDAGIWSRGGAIAVPGSGGAFLVATGNGSWDGHTYWGDAVVELSPAGKMVGNYAPTNTADLYNRDLDLGSTSPVYLAPGLIAQGGKDGTIRLLSLAGMQGAAPHKGQELQVVPTPAGLPILTQPAVWREDGTWLIAADGGATEAWMLLNSRLVPEWQQPNPGTSPVLAGGLLYVYDPTGGGLRVYEPATGALVTTLPAGSGHWNSPIVTDGFIALPEGNANDRATTGVLDIWHLS